ncbi:MAG: ribonuclease D [Deltaproteobacteria bacterium]|nr:ribonuclease D [Deltaproteobacteria bacterium]
MVTRWIRTAPQLDELVGELAGCRAIGFDLEGDSLHHYAEKICLVQVTGAGVGSWLVDPLALGDLAPLGPIFADASVVKVVHGGANDVTSLRRDFGFTFRTMFDTMIAARLLGDTEVGLQALVFNELGVELSKSSQKDDWSKRPLTAKQEAYALADVAHLMALAGRLTERLAAAGRTEWAREEFAELAALQAVAKDRNGPDEFRRIKGSAKLSRRKQAVLRELYAWREQRAEAADVPPFKIVGPDVLFELADGLPTTLAAVGDALAPYRRQSSQAGAVLAAIERGLAVPDGELPAREPACPPGLTGEARARVERLRSWRDDQAARSQLDPAVVMPNRVIERIAAADPRTADELAAVEGVRRWRVVAWGPALLASVTGRAQPAAR